MLEDLWSWSSEKDPGSSILWLYGPAGAGKSAIAQSFCEKLKTAGLAGTGGSAQSFVDSFYQTLETKDRLGASFFFKREHSSRGHGNKLFPTIAYQLSQSLPEMKHAISEIVEDDPSIIDLEISTQLQKLIIEPWQRSRITRAISKVIVTEPPIITAKLATELQKLTKPWSWQQTTHAMAQIVKEHPFIIDLELQRQIEKVLIVIIDGLDECNSQAIQQEILRSIGTITVHKKPLPLRFLVASRPEPHIRKIFTGSLNKIHRPLNIHSSLDDVRKYLQDEFSRIHREHEETMIAVPSPWPSQKVVDELVEKSSGYFIYASTVIRFIDDRDFRPTDQLKIILGIRKPDFGSPYGTLDQLYTQIISAVPARPQLLEILHFISTKPFRLSIPHIEQLLDLEPGDFRLFLRGLQSVIQLPPNDASLPIFYHASFLDFLHDPARSGIFYIGDQYKENLACHILKAYSYLNGDPLLNAKGHVTW
ncbi:NACHT domain-containing protein [Mycena venus]|uniref:NACHT domain-containing protein n=1 Tax=Mycena venus TaxID=2733690 RepID=A0A8H7DCP9_9AGAR|nr:NACHT domain-containing protein [Mycena venus]